VKVAGFPLEAVPQLADRQVKGRVSGQIALEGLHKDARVKGELGIDGLEVGKVRYEKGFVTVASGEGKLAANVRLSQKDGFLDASASTGLAWGAELAPKLDERQPLEAKIIAKAFRAAVIQPFVQNAVPVLDGRIDANATARIVPGQPGAALEGRVTFRDGTLLVNALGDELRKVRATADFSPDGTIRVTDVSAAGIQGEIKADAVAKLEGMRVAIATANIHIPQKKPFSLAVQGQPVGEIAGDIKVVAAQPPNSNATSITVEIPKLWVELPQVTKTGVQQLGEKENIRVGVYRGPKDFVTLPLDKEDTVPEEKKAELEAETSRLEVAVRLGRAEVRRGNTAFIAATGNTDVSIGATTKITGQIRTIEGWADVQGKKFEIEKATVTFNGEPEPDPVINATAGWTAADGSRVYADFVGPVSTGKVTLRSEPPRPKNEILAIILFGTADGANPRPPQSRQQNDGATKAAVGLGGGFAAEGLTEALDDLTGIQTTARIDTTRSNNPKPELEFQVSPKVSVSFAHVIGTPPVTQPDKTFASVEYRFRRNWSVETTIGNRGTTLLDAVWQKRY
jgi:translocation and assembly module TamB